MRFRDIKQFTRSANYRVTMPFDMIEKTLADWAKYGPVELNPDFQRGHVWTPEQQSRYVEFILKGGKSSREIYWNCKGFSAAEIGQTMYLVDGKQRLEAMRKFMANEVVVFGEYRFSDFTDRLSLTDGFFFNVNDLPTRKEMLQWYIDLNAGGTVHTSEEIEKVRKMIEAEK